MKLTPEMQKYIARNHAVPFDAMAQYAPQSPKSLTVKDTDIYLDGVIVDSATDAMYKAWGLDLNFVTPESVRNALDEVGGGDVTLWINSPGGSVFDASAILTSIQRYQKNAAVNVVVDGMAASAATYLAVHGDNRQIGKMAMFMIHNSWTCACGNSEQMRQVADVMDKIDGSYAEMMSEKSSMSEKDLRKAMSQETWYTGKEAVEAGFMDSVYEAEKSSSAKPQQSADMRFTQLHDDLQQLVHMA